MGAFKQPHGGKLRELYLPEHQADEVRAEAGELASWDLSPRQLCDLDLLLNGAFSPLEGFLCQADYESVCDTMRLQSGILWPMPITLDVSAAFAEQVGVGDTIALRDSEGVLIATMEIAEQCAAGFRNDRRQPSGGRLPDASVGARVSRRQGARHRTAHVSRFQTAA